MTALKLIPTAMIFGTCSDRQVAYVNNGCSQIIPFKKVKGYSVQRPVCGKLKLPSVTDNNLINNNYLIIMMIIIIIIIIIINVMKKNFKTTTTARTGDGRRVAGGIVISSFRRHVNSVCRRVIISIS